MAAPVTLAIDAMSGDHGQSVAVDAALRSLAEFPNLKLVLVGDEAALRKSLRSHRHVDDARLSIHAASEVVAMDEPLSKAVRKKDSSMRVAITLVKEKRVQAAVSAGNTGALMAIARGVLKTLPGIDRPALITPLPATTGMTHVLDLGANADCSAEQLVQFAVMGSALVSALNGIDRPRVALLNIGEEEIKGNGTIKAASAMLNASSLNYTGYIEGDSIFLHPVDVVVCDGFVGNVALKAGEGVAKLMGHYMREEFTRSLPNKLVGLIARSVLRALAKRMDPRMYNGASFLGLQGTVIKSHGGADALGFANAIKVAMREVEMDVPARISRLLGAAIVPPPLVLSALK
jgi:glycerol-3-phosphate acyltransferase PlsX